MRLTDSVAVRVDGSEAAHLQRVAAHRRRRQDDLVDLGVVGVVEERQLAMVQVRVVADCEQVPVPPLTCGQKDNREKTGITLASVRFSMIHSVSQSCAENLPEILVKETPRWSHSAMSKFHISGRKNHKVLPADV